MKLVSQSEAARIVGVSKQAIHKMRHRGATFFYDTKVDIDSDEWKLYVASKSMSRQSVAAMEKKLTEEMLFESADKKPKNQSEPWIKKRQEEIEANKATEYMQRQTGIDAYSLPMKMQTARLAKTLEEVKKATLVRKRLEGELIDKNEVDRLVFDYLNAFNINILRLPSNMVDRVMQISDSKDENRRQKIINLLSDEISKEIKSVKRQMVKNIEALGNGE
jgi:hypothetical protein